MALRSDDFNRADSTTSLGTSSSGHTWTESFGNLGILSNQAYTTSVNNNQAFIDAGVSDIDIRVTIDGTFSGVARAGVSFRGTASPDSHRNTWRFQRNSTGASSCLLVRTEENVNTFTEFDDTEVFAGDVLRVVAVGDRIVCYVNDKQVIEVTDSTHQTNTRHGIVIIDTAPRLDDWSVDAAELGASESVSTTTATNEPVPSIAARAVEYIR